MNMSGYFRVKFLVFALAIVIAGVFFYVEFKNQKNVILIVLDTTRADHLSPYGYERDTSPNLKAFADENVVFDFAVTASPWTPPSIATMITGLYPVGHGMMPVNSRAAASRNLQVLGQNFSTMAEVLSSNGYATAGISPNPWTTKTFGFDQGFDQYYFRRRARADEVTLASKKMLADLKASKKPFFMFVHYMDPHWPYDAPAPFSDKFTGDLKNQKYDAEMQERINHYDSEIAFMDKHVGELLAHLKSEGVTDNSLILIISDHGEQFNEHGNTEHGKQLFNEEVHVALMMRDGSKAHRVESLASNIDLLPTVLRYCGINADLSLHGLDLRDEGELAKRSGVITEIKNLFNLRAFVAQDRKKIILNYGDTDSKPEALKAPPELIGVFDPKSDPLELSPNKDEKLSKPLSDSLEVNYEKLIKNAGGSEAIEVQKDTLDQLKSMGYLK